jgi:hypothetical protein
MINKTNDRTAYEVHVGYERVRNDGDYYMYHMPNGVLNMIFEVDIYEENKNFIKVKASCISNDLRIIHDLFFFS